MNTTKLICPNEPSLLDRLDKRHLCVRVGSPGEIVAAANKARERNRLFCVLYDAEAPIETIDLDESWLGLPIALTAPALGRFRNVAGKLPLLKKLDIRVYFPCEEGNLVGARLLASLGVPSGLAFDFARPPDWEALADLMTYALLGAAPHAPVEPFQTMADGCRQGLRGEDWGRAMFDDPSQFLHLDATGRIALSRRELLAGEFVAQDLSALDSPALARAVAERLESWRNLFLDNHVCARCGGWKLCRGRFADAKTEPDGCAEFFEDMMDVVEQSWKRADLKKPVEQWRP
jgi:hypothetical protein